MTINFKALPTDEVRQLQNGGLDANGQAPEVSVSDGNGNPCRHCLSEIPNGEKMLILAFRPFPSPQPYAEQGPLFLCAAECERHAESEELPDLFNLVDSLLVRGYNTDNRIIYGTGKVRPVSEVVSTAEMLFENPDVKFIHLRSSKNNCYQCRIERG
ncbi:MAG: hypothetical protein ACI9EW_000073 [Cellvibrionaceae bacterium]|jgi:hypothetical protein